MIAHTRTWSREWGIYWDNGKDNGDYYSILGLYRDTGKENGNYYNIELATSSGWCKSTEFPDHTKFKLPCSTPYLASGGLECFRV